MDWLAFLKHEEQRRTKQDVYLAQIAAEIRRMLVKHPKQVQVEQFFLKVASAEQKNTIEKSKSIWCAALGIKRN